MICNPSSGGGNLSPKLIVVEQKLIDKQVAYLILNGIRKSWIKLCEATDQEMKAIMQYQSDKNNGVQPIYHPEADDGHDSVRGNDQNQNSTIKNHNKYNLRQRELLLITKNQFYGLRPNQEKKQNITTNQKTKNQIKKEEVKVRVRSTHKKQDENYQVHSKKQTKSKLQGSKGKLEEAVLRKNRRKKKQPEIIEVQVYNPKRKIIKKQDAIKDERPKTIQIYDGSDSDLQMM